MSDNPATGKNAHPALKSGLDRAVAGGGIRVRFRLTIKHNTVQIVAEQRELPGECLQNAGSPDGLRRFRYFTGRSLNGIAIKQLNRDRDLDRHHPHYASDGASQARTMIRFPASRITSTGIPWSM